MVYLAVGADDDLQRDIAVATDEVDEEANYSVDLAVDGE